MPDTNIWPDPLDPDVRPVRISTQYALPERFGATVEPTDLLAPACHLVVEVQEQRPVCTELTLMQRGGRAISANELRRVPVADYVRRAVDEHGLLGDPGARVRGRRHHHQLRRREAPASVPAHR